MLAHELPDFEHYDLERPADFSLLSSDPELFPVLRHVVDKDRWSGRFVLLGSSGPLLLRNVSETLAGRIGILELRPFSMAELAGRFDWRTRWWRGGLPPLYDLAGGAQQMVWLDSYIQAVLERDLPLPGVRVPSVRLHRFWSMLTAVHGQLLNVSMLSRSLEVSATAVANCLDILEGALLIRRLQPFHANIRKRLVKSPKLYIRDSGILHRLAGLTDEASLEIWAHRGASFEALVVEELIAAATNQLPGPEFYFYRTQAGAEVDLIIRDGLRMCRWRSSSASEIRHYDTAGLRRCMEDLGMERGFVVTRAEETRSLGRGAYSLPLEQLAAGAVYPWTFDR